MTYSYLAIGHLCYDLHQRKHILGGTASYSSLIAQKLSQRGAILTSIGSDFQFFDFFAEKGIKVHHQLAKQTTVFENIYNKAIGNTQSEGQAERTQFLRARANTIRNTNLPKHLLKTPIVHVGLIANELDFDLLNQFPNSLIGGSIQGCLRQWDAQGKVSPCEMDWSLLQKLDIIFISVDDIIGIENALDNILAFAKHVVVTQGKNGATIYKDDSKYFFPSYPTDEVDPTGAGDAFATAYLLNYCQTKSIESAAIYAHCIASIVVESVGLSGLDSIDRVELRVADYNKKLS